MKDELKVEWVKIGSVKTNPGNPRIIKDDKFKKLVESIQSFPEMLLLRPIVINSEGVILGGNMRLKALQELKYKEIPVVRANDLSDAQQREFLIKDNVGFGIWDWDILANEWDANELADWGLDLPGDVEEESEEGQGMEGKKIEIDVEETDYPEAMQLIEFWENNNAYIAGMFISFLRDEKTKFKKLIPENENA
jgi:hypothetical protein